MPLNRVVALFTPVFAAAAAVGTGLLTKYVGVSIPASDIVALEIAGASVAAGSALKWLHGSQLAEKYAHEIQLQANALAHAAAVEGIKIPTESELVKAAEAEAARLAAQLASTVNQLNVAKGDVSAQSQRAAAAENNLHLIRQAVGHVRGDANLVTAVVADAQPSSIVQPEDEVASDVAASAPAVIAQAPVAADVTDRAPISQAV